jgi:hypothetical protein
MAKQRCGWLKDMLAVFLAFGGAGAAVWLMLQGEVLSQLPLGVTVTDAARAVALNGLTMYFKGIGGAIFLCSVAYILVGQDDTVVTSADNQKR